MAASRNPRRTSFKPSNPQDDDHTWEGGLLHTIVHELGHAYIIEALGMEVRRCTIDLNRDYKPGECYWHGHTSNRDHNKATEEQDVLISIAGVVAEMMWFYPRITAIDIAFNLEDNLNVEDGKHPWGFKEVDRCKRLLRKRWPELQTEAKEWYTRILASYPKPEGCD